MIKSIAIALAIAGVLAVAGCGGSSGSSSSGGAYGGEESTGTSKEANNETNATSTFVKVGNAAGVGKVLVDSEGMTLYYFEKDQGGKSACYGACAEAWPPATTDAGPHGEGIMPSKLSTTKRSDGATQLTYAGWPLYTYAGDTKPGEDNGTDSKAFGASWYPLHPNGEKAGH